MPIRHPNRGNSGFQISRLT